MKKLLFLLMVAITVTSAAWAQDDEVLARVDLLNKTVFGTKDSATLDGLLASELTYGHSGGKLEDRKEALHAATTNGNVYSELSMKDFKVFYKGKSAIVRYTVSFVQTTNGTPVKLTLGMLQVWVKENKKWKLTARQAVKLAS
jgi:hypothetical protein